MDVSLIALWASLITTTILSVLFMAFYFVKRKQNDSRRKALLQQLHDLEALQDASNALGAAQLSIVALSALIAEEAGKIIDNSTIQIGLFEGDLYKVLFEHIEGVVQDTPARHNLRQYPGLVGWVRAHREPILINDFEREKDQLPAVLYPISLATAPRSALFIPLINANAATGIIVAQHPAPQKFNVEDRKRLMILANQAAAAIASTQLYEQERARANDIVQVSAIAKQVNMFTNAREIFRQVVQLVHEQLGFHHVMILSIDPRTGEAINEAGNLAIPHATMRVVPGVGLIGAVIKSRETVLVNNVAADTRYREEVGILEYDRVAQETRAEMVIPLLYDEKLVGALDVHSNKVGGFSQREQTVLQALANEVAAIIDKAQKSAEKEELAWASHVQFQLAQTISHNRGAENVLVAAARLLHMLMGLEQCGVLLWDETNKHYRPILPPGPPLTIEAWRPLAAVHIGQTSYTTHQPPPWMTDRLTEPLILFPLLGEDRRLGVFYVQDSAESIPFHPLTAQRRWDMLRRLVTQISEGIERQQLRLAQQEEAWVNTALLQVAEAVNKLINLDEILNTIVRLVPILVGVKACVVLMWDADRDAFQTGPSHGLTLAERERIGQLDIDMSQIIVLEPQAEHDQLTETSVYQLPLPADLMGGESAEIIPLIARNQLAGALIVSSTFDCLPLTGKRLNILIGIAQQATVAVVNDGLYKESAEQEILRQELNVALDIQASLLPNGSPPIPSCTVASYWNAARQVSGDFYDFLRLSNGDWAIVIADVSGKGMPAAIFMVLCRTIIRAVTLSPYRRAPLKAMKRINDIILKDSASDLFVTVFFTIWNAETRTLTYVNGGHNPPLLLKSTGEIEIVGGYGIALGVIESAPLQEHTLQVSPGDTLIFYTDGVTEAMNADYEPFGLERLKQTLVLCHADTPQQLIDTINQALLAHAGDTPQSDDVTLVVMQVNCDN